MTAREKNSHLLVYSSNHFNDLRRWMGLGLNPGTMVWAVLTAGPSTCPELMFVMASELSVLKGKTATRIAVTKPGLAVQ